MLFELRSWRIDQRRRVSASWGLVVVLMENFRREYHRGLWVLYPPLVDGRLHDLQYLGGVHPSRLPHPHPSVRKRSVLLYIPHTLLLFSSLMSSNKCQETSGRNGLSRWQFKVFIPSGREDVVAGVEGPWSLPMPSQEQRVNSRAGIQNLQVLTQGPTFFCESLPH